nr:NDP-hexose 4-ketoreductase [Actinomycetales bacterium]
IVFPQLTQEQIVQIVDLMIAQLDERMRAQGMTIRLTDAAKQLLAERGYDPVLGARPLRRAIQREIEDALSERILFGELKAGQKVIVDAEGEGILGEFTFTGVARGADDSDATAEIEANEDIHAMFSGPSAPIRPIEGGSAAGSGGASMA